MLIMPGKFLVVIGCQKEKLDIVGKRFERKILDFINANSFKYDGVISIVRKKMDGDRNFRKSGDSVATDRLDFLDYESDQIIAVPGYDVDCTKMRRDAHYDICGISTAASVLCSALSMYSQGLDISVLSEYCADRKGERLHKSALAIMKEYMPNCVV